MKVLLLFGLVAFSVALPTFTGRYLTFGEDGTITLKSFNGYELDIFNSLTRPRVLNVVVKTPGSVPRTLEIDEANNNQFDALRAVLKHYEGTLDETSFYALLTKIQFLVQAGVLDQTLSDVMRDWDLKCRTHQVSDVVTESQDYGLHGEWFVSIPSHRQFLEQYDNTLFEQDSFDRDLYKWTVQQQWINQQVEQLHLTGTVSEEEFVQEITERQALLNRQAEKCIEDLIHQQSVVTYEIENSLQQQHFASSDLVNRQRIVYRRIHHLIERLTYQKSFVDRMIVQRVQRGFSSIHRQFYIQHNVLSEQVYRLIQQIFFQHVHVKRQFQFFYQHQDVLPQELIALEELTYRQVETFIPALIQHLIYQQEYVRYYFASIHKMGEVIPEIVLNHYFNFYQRLIELTVEGDLVPKQLYYQQKEIHQQIVQLVKENREKHLSGEVADQMVYRPREDLEQYHQLPWYSFLQRQYPSEYSQQRYEQEQEYPYHQFWYLLPQQKYEREGMTAFPGDNIYRRYQTVY
ncbi:uncharacterized protein LOC130450078 [Diorhabda sublineata]|uniref:uncharacterized protein LOC130450078 n=1 Tax=Diorhabda sublineata TaxID=1163346 RepID=UPI0024E063DC|nr:uncharacterized protein LOC130450078 [Diorhabda sublineata]